MGELGGFLKIERIGRRSTATRTSASTTTSEFLVQRPGRGAARAGRALHGVRHPVLPQRLPARQPHPGLERPRLPRPLARRDPPAARDEQLPRVHRAAVPGAVRGRLRAGDPRGRRGHDQADRELDHRPRVGRGLGRAAAAAAPRPASPSRSSAPGPAGMAAAQQLRREGHRVVLFERDEAAGGLVRFGVPDFKIEKCVVERRVAAAARRGRRAAPAASTSASTSPSSELREEFDAVVLATGSRVPRDLPAPGRELDGIHFAMDYLYGRNRWVADGSYEPPISAAGKHVVVIGGGDTGADCVANSDREGALSITQLELLPEPPPKRPDDRTPWPLWPQKFRLSYAMEEAHGARQGRAGLLRHDDALQRRGRPRHRAARRARRARRRRSARRSRAPSSRSRPTSSCSRWASCTPSRAARPARRGQGPARQRQGRAPTRPPCPACSPPATRAAASRSSSGRSTRAASARGWSTATSARSSPRELIHAGNVEPADDGPEGPPQGRARYGVAAGAR